MESKRMPTAERSIPNRLAVVEYLQGAGWKIKKSLLYEHCKRGHLAPQKDGTYSPAAVDKYARLHLQRLDGTPKDTTVMDTLQEKKVQAETDKMIAQAEHWTIRARVAAGQFVPREAFEVALAKRAAIFRNDLETFATAEASRIVQCCSGDVGRIPDLIEYLLGRIEAFLARYAEETPIQSTPAFLLVEGSEKEAEDGDDDE
jgi:hypothetical protein